MTWSDQNNETFYKRMIETLRLAASAPDLQLAEFPLFVDRPSEIATEVGDCLLYVRKLREAGDISADILDGYRKLNDHLDFGAGSELWSEESVKTAAVWQEARELAQGVLDNMGVKYARPDLFWMAENSTYVPVSADRREHLRGGRVIQVGWVMSVLLIVIVYLIGR